MTRTLAALTGKNWDFVIRAKGMLISWKKRVPPHADFVRVGHNCSRSFTCTSLYFNNILIFIVLSFQEDRSECVSVCVCVCVCGLYACMCVCVCVCVCESFAKLTNVGLYLSV